MGWIALATALIANGADTDAAAGATEPPQVVEAAAATEAIAETTEVPVIETIAMEIERYRRMTVEVTIGGQGPFNFMVDTGAQATVLSRALADQLELHDRDNATLVAMASTREVQTALVPDFTLGERTMTIRTAPLVEAMHIGDADGILGLDALQDSKVLLDFARGEMHVVETLPDGASSYDIVVRARDRLGQLIIHRAEIDGVSVDVIIDTGAQGSVGNRSLERRLRNRQSLEDAEMTDVNGVTVTGQTRVARRLQLGRVYVNNVAISFADSPTFAALDLEGRPALILGMSELRVFERVAIDFHTRRVLFDLPGDVPLDAAFRFNRRASRLDN